jgi:hypothetical protein
MNHITPTELGEWVRLHPPVACIVDRSSTIPRVTLLAERSHSLSDLSSEQLTYMREQNWLPDYIIAGLRNIGISV